MENVTSDEMEQKKTAFRRVARKLCGQRISHVSYVAIDYEGGECYWDLGTVHAPEFGLDLRLDNGQAIGITWGSDFYPHALSLTDGPLRDEVFGPGVWDVTTERHWASLINQKIEEIILYWYQWEEKYVQIQPSLETGTKFQVAPIDLELLFESGERVYFISAEYDLEFDPPKVLCDDNISVIFDEETAHRCQVGKYYERPSDYQVEVRPEVLCKTADG